MGSTETEAIDHGEPDEIIFKRMQSIVYPMMGETALILYHFPGMTSRELHDAISLRGNETHASIAIFSVADFDDDFKPYLPERTRSYLAGLDERGELPALSESEEGLPIEVADLAPHVHTPREEWP